MEERVLKLHRVKDFSISELHSYMAGLVRHVQERERGQVLLRRSAKTHADMDA